MKLTNYIQEHHNGNISAFARTQGVRQDQVGRWIKRDCLFIDGSVYCEANKSNKQNDLINDEITNLKEK